MKAKQLPIGFVIAQTAKTTTRIFSEVLESAGGSLSAWLILLSLQATGECLQSGLAEAVGVQGPTLTHHLNDLESGGFLKRIRIDGDRRSHLVRITDRGRRKFAQMRKAAQAYDTHLNTALSASEMRKFREFLARVSETAGR